MHRDIFEHAGYECWVEHCPGGCEPVVWVPVTHPQAVSLSSNGQIERRFADRLDCVIALTEVARAMRERAEQRAANFPRGTYDTWDRTLDAQAGDTRREGD